MEQKGKIAQYFCKHQNTDKFKKVTMFQILGGERTYEICNDCGKLIKSEFVHNY